jgi:hypothetical protein
MSIITELYDGKQVELQDPTLRIGNNTHPRVTIMSHRKNWSFLCRFHDEVHPRQRYVSVVAFVTFHKIRKYNNLKYYFFEN